MTRIEPLTTLSLDPALRLLLAQAGLELPRILPADGWRVMEAFAALPVAHDDDGVSFQAELAVEEDAEPVFSVMFVRQLGDPLPDGQRRVRRVALQYLYAPPPAGSGLRLDGQNLWHADYPDWPSFAAAVEGTDEFRYAMTARPEHVALFDEEDLLDDAQP